MSGERLTIHASCGLGDMIHVERLRFAEALDEPYVAIVDIRTPGDTDPDMSVVLGADATVELARDDGGHRRVTGIVRTTRTLVGTDQASDTGGMRFEIVPALWMLTLRRDTRMFQLMSVPDILEQVLGDALGDYGRSVQNELDADYPVREYCMQYQESDFDFVHRLMEEEGISYGFDHSGDPEVMVLRDANASYPEAEVIEDPIVFRPDAHVVRDGEPVHRFERLHTTTINKVALREFDFSRGSHLIEDEEGDADEHGRTRESYEHGWGRSVTLWDYNPTSYGQDDAATQKVIRLQAHQEQGLVGRGLGRVLGMIPGTTFELSGHPAPGLDGKYLVTRVEHANESALGSEERYHNRFECIPYDVPHRPRRKAHKPRIGSIQTAVVTGPAGEEIHTDEHGRIKVQFHWDRENPADETSSCWIRVQQKWAGAGWGFWWLPRIGMEVIVQFVDGDPDRPLVTGCVYDGANPTPYALPDEKTKSTIKSNSSPGGGGFNEFRFEDKAGEEEIYTHAQKDYNEVVENDHTTLVHHDQTNEVDNDQTQTIHNNQTERVDVDQDLSVGGNRSLHIEGNFTEQIDGTETRHVVGAVSEDFAANETRDVTGDLTEDLQANETRTIGANQTETISGNRSQTIGGASSQTVTGALTETVTGGITLDTPADWTVTATGGYTVICPGGLNINAPGGFQLGIPGGVNQIDSFAELVVSICGSKGAIQRGVCVYKNEKFGANIATIGGAISANGPWAFVGFSFQTGSGFFETSAAVAKTGAAKVRALFSSDA